MSAGIEVKGLTELIQRMSDYPRQLKEAMKVAVDATLLALWGAVPPYPAPPQGSKYVRTGTLGRSLGSGDGGGASGGHPSIFTEKNLGNANFEARFGTNLEYAPYVIGDNTQAWMHQGRWWVMADIATAAAQKISEIFNALADRLVEFLEGSGSHWGDPGMGE